MYDITKISKKKGIGNVQAFVTMYLPFIFKCFHEQHTQWHKKASWKYRTRKSPGGQKCFSFFFLL